MNNNFKQSQNYGHRQSSQSGQNKAYSNNQDPVMANYWMEIKQGITNKKPSAVIEVAKKIAETLSNEVGSTQMRKFLDEIVKIHPYQIDITKEIKPLDENIRASLAILRPKFAYTVSKTGKQNLMRLFYTDVLDKWLSRADEFTELELEYLHLFIESLIAYHKVRTTK